MGHSNEDLNAGLDDDFIGVVDQMKGLFSQVASLFRGRATHTWGVAAKGTAQIIPSPGFPESEFLTPGTTYRITMRHSTPGPELDDRTLDGGAASIKFHRDEADGEGFHDVMMNTGKVLFVESARAFNTMVQTLPNRSITDPQELRADFVKRRAKLVTDGIVHDDKLTLGYRTGSFTEFYYHSQVCFEYNDRYYLRYRMIPADRGPERGLFPASIRSQGRTTDPPWPDDHRAEDHMRRDFQMRVRRLGVRYILQVQLRPIDVNDDPWAEKQERDRIAQGLEPIALNPTLYWEPRYYPWHDLALLSFDDMLASEEMSDLAFDANRTDDSIKIPLVTSPRVTADPRPQADRWSSFCHSRPLVYYAARQARAAAEKPHAN
ncbi:catalase family protein [Roseiconus lacunae]|uniref:hypothetical protein n=1 Tax=Roseiconus lacunae TaxID=2605694 RepID=UPI001E5E1D94|nr:hypothetical protein [Roseiconus lacunae]MCD0462375.1 hypothetical protein [Roseiconus lacunae]